MSVQAQSRWLVLHYRTLDSSNHLRAVPWAYTAPRRNRDIAVLDLAGCSDYLDMVLEAPSL